ncbi:DUF72 domain-containing protein [Microlunatus ginsengisoli]|uniref:DUF72 domain-containing protein n=1 Tax=Microlunatus ginsengisoli TaxID=363863 RepID=A0ABP7AGY6_9ACTN
MIRIGISGWTYPPWRGRFYPPKLAHRRELAYAAGTFNSIEVNGTFYGLQRPGAFASWAEQTPDDFVFAVKGSRFITHLKKLTDVRTPLANFFASGVLALDRKLGPLLWQLPPNLGFDSARLSDFFDQLPRSLGAAASLAREHDQRIPADRELVNAVHPRHRLRHALEVRHDSFRTPELISVLREHRIALVLADNPGNWPVMDETTTSFRYVRLHGDTELYASGYSDEALDSWAARIRAWSEAGQDVYVYCDNDTKVRAPYDAMGLMGRLGIRPTPSPENGEAGR